MDKPIICGKPATKLSEIVIWEDVGYNVWMYVVADTSAHIHEREDAFALARNWFPDLEDDEEE